MRVCSTYVSNDGGDWLFHYHDSADNHEPKPQTMARFQKELPEVLALLDKENIESEEQAFELFMEKMLTDKDFLDDISMDMPQADIDMDNALEELFNSHTPKTEDKAYQKIDKLCDKYPQRIDFLYNAYEFAPDWFVDKGFMRLNMAVLIGLNALAQAGFDWQKDELHWGFVENRPFMRAYARYAQEIMERYHDIRQVMFIQQRLLKACPTDNLGIRHEYVQSLLFCKKYKEVIKLYKTYPDDFDPSIVYGVAFASWQLGQKSADKYLKKAIQEFPLCAKELLKKRHAMPSDGYAHGGIMVGSPAQAYEFWQQYGQFWQKDALDWLKQHTNEQDKKIKSPNKK